MLLHDADGLHQRWRLTCLRHQVRGTVRVCRRGYKIRRGLWRGRTYIYWEGLPMLCLGGDHASWREWRDPFRCEPDLFFVVNVDAYAEE